MKKLLIPLAAILALTACSKVVPTAVEAGEREVTFEVANYVARTKANEKSLAQEFKTFHTFAIFHSTDPANPNQWFFEDEEIFSEGEGGSISKWAPAGSHFWPKTGDISFYSYAGTRQPSEWPQPGMEDNDNRVMSFGVNVDAGQDEDFEPLIIRGIPEVGENGTDFLPADNILVADPAYKFQQSVADPYGVDRLNPAKGVPTLFHHMLAKVRFQIVLDATASDENTTWTLTLPEMQHLLSVPNEGSLVVRYPAIPSTYNTAVSLGTDVMWSLEMGNKRFAEIWARPMEISAVGATSVEDDLISVPEIEGQVFEREFVVIPQRFDELEFHFECVLSNVYTGGEKEEPGVTETLRIPANPKTMATMGMFIPDYNPQQAYSWEPNHIYTYRIIVKTTGEITFDPAVADWTPEETENPEF